jgi:hypothetical protein
MDNLLKVDNQLALGFLLRLLACPMSSSGSAQFLDLIHDAGSAPGSRSWIPASAIEAR